MKRIAIIFDGDLTFPKGIVNASLNRIKYLKKHSDFEIDVYAIQTYENVFIRFLKNKQKRKRLNEIVIDGIKIKLLWISFSLLDYFLVYKLGYKPLFTNGWYEKHLKLFELYDALSVHSIFCGKFALKIYQKYGIPYFVTWHGSDIHTFPFHNKYDKLYTINVIENSACNFFVSKGLLDDSEKLTRKGRKQVLYNGVSESFVKYSDDEKKVLKKLWNIERKKVVAFIGNLFPVKNVLLLPDIFKNVCDKYGDGIEFWVVGDGKLRDELQNSLNRNEIDYKFWGNQPPHKMPDIMNCIDVLVLPSKNESFGLVIVEALACGANVVASNVGGIPEILASDNIFELDNQFVNNISNRIVEMLNSHIEQLLNETFSWKRTAELEATIYKEMIISNN